MLLIIDNYDSFVFNILQWLDYPADQIKVLRNDDVSLKQLTVADVEAVIISPGPMSPGEAGYSNEAVRLFGESGIPVLGICLGHQCIGHVYGCVVGRHPRPAHGKEAIVELQRSALFNGLPERITVGRYHSLHVEMHSVDHPQLKVTATLDDGTVMALEHRHYPIYGVQFHPESVLTGAPGKTVLSNFLTIAGLKPRSKITPAVSGF
ncbi:MULTISPECIES: anthranilate synthase component II [Pseudomonas]|uniref:Aminodeoxychorismate/anthranilate synthase component 2 n=1 Tax=Pseudomonas fluorescens TaxID=294 RepID=A0A109LB98_PSEFL|nr:MULTISPECIES: aminodeoxychorismate/anthranilate synthase component II [Pseudomonas]KWV84426.1 Aminodeoxychorismate/anthranilate synthase component 2 [Pseudomonas fluorescens]OOV93186.1 type 1 glutamine amidotransferase [Pseudomonas sp. MF6396]